MFLEYLRVVFGANLGRAGTCFHHYHEAFFISSSAGPLGTQWEPERLGIEGKPPTRHRNTLISMASLNLFSFADKIVLKTLFYRIVEMIRNYTRVGKNG